MCNVFHVSKNSTHTKELNTMHTTTTAHLPAAELIARETGQFTPRPRAYVGVHHAR